jgi:hypothetical protein
MEAMQYPAFRQGICFYIDHVTIFSREKGVSPGIHPGSEDKEGISIVKNLIEVLLIRGKTGPFELTRYQLVRIKK